MNSGKVFLSVLAGAAVGAAIGILFAPKKGSVTRRYISKKGNKYGHDLEEKFNEFIDSVTDKLESVKEEAIHVAKMGKHKMEEAEVELKSAKK